MRLGSLAVTQVALIASAVAPASVMSAQALNRTLDEGTFLISRGGTPLGPRRQTLELRCRLSK